MSRIEFFAACLALLCFGCTDARYTRARSLLQGEYYEDATYFAEELLAESPEDPEYRSLLETAKAEAFRFYLEKARACQDSDIQSARYYFAKAQEMNPGDQAVARIESEIDARKSEIQSAVDRAELAMSRQEWDEAITCLLGMQKYSASFRELRTTLEVAVRESFDFHFREGSRLFEEQEYERAAAEFDLCLQREQGDSQARMWRQIADLHLRARRKIAEAWRLLDKNEHRSALESFEDARKTLAEEKSGHREITLCRDIEKGMDMARRKWAVDLYGRGVREQARQTRATHIEALRLFGECLKQVPDFRDCGPRVRTIRRDLALWMQKDALALLDFPRIRYAALAHRLLREAARHDPKAPRLSEDLLKSEKICRLKLGIDAKVRTQGDSGYCRTLERGLIDWINSRRYPFVTASSGGTDGLHEARVRELRRFGCCQEERPADLSFEIYRIHLEVLRSFARKTGEISAFDRASSFYSHARSIDSLEYLEHQGRLYFRRREAPVLRSMLESVRDEVLSRKQIWESAEDRVRECRDSLAEIERELGKSNAERDRLRNERSLIETRMAQNASAIRSCDAQIENSRRQAANAKTDQERRYYEDQIARISSDRSRLVRYNENEAPPRLSEIASRTGQIESAIDRMEDSREDAQRSLHEAESASREAGSAHSEAEAQSRRLEDEFRESESDLRSLSSEPARAEELKLRSAYTYRFHPCQSFGAVWIRGFLLDACSDVRLLDLDISKEERLEEQTTVGVHALDARGIKPHAENLPEPEELERDLQTQAMEALKLKLDLFFRRHHERYLERASRALKENRTLDAGENLALFVMCLEEGDGNREALEEARLRLQEIVDAPLE